LGLRVPSDNATLRAYLKVQMGWERELATLLSQAAADAHQHIERIRSSAGIGDQVRAAQLRQAQRAILRQQSALWKTIGESVKAAEAEAAAAVMHVAAQYDDELLSRVMGPSGRDLYARSLESTARSGVDAAKARMQGKSYIPLSEQVYKSEQWSNGVLNNTINSGLAQGLSAAEIADSVKDFINPRTPGGVKYAAQRLGRTEINNAAHATSLSKYAKTPWVTAVRWQLSGSHPRPDECNQYADVGLYPPEDVPEKPHPNCLCYVTPDTVSPEEFAKQYNSGAYDAYLDDVMREAGYSEDLIALTKSKAAPAFTGPALGSGFDKFKRISPENHQDAMTAANPKRRNRGQDYKVNCAKVVNSYELRRRGYDVVPSGKSAGENWDQFRGHWTNADGSYAKQKAARSAEEFAEKHADDPAGSRYICYIEWEGKTTSHVFSAEKLADGTFNFFDAQDYTNAKRYFKDANRKGVPSIRVDNLVLNEDVIRLGWIENP